MEPSEMPWSKLLPIASGCRHSIVPAAGLPGVTVPVPALHRERGYSLCLSIGLQELTDVSLFEAPSARLHLRGLGRIEHCWNSSLANFKHSLL